MIKPHDSIIVQTLGRFVIPVVQILVFTYYFLGNTDQEEVLLGE